MEELYILLVDTPGIFAYAIRKYLGQNYIHVALALDINLDYTYSVGRRNPFIPYFSGFVRENTGQILKKFPGARYRIVKLPCTTGQKIGIQQALEECYQKRFQTHYCILGLPFLLCGKPFYQTNHYTCSSFLAKLLTEYGMDLFDKHFSLVTPRDFMELPETTLIYEGRLSEYYDPECGIQLESVRV